MAWGSAVFGIPDPYLSDSPALKAFRDGFNIALSSEQNLLDVSNLERSL